MQEFSEQNYIVKTHVFEGPLDLLLSLIEERKLFVNEISLSSITEEYAAHVTQIKEDLIPSKYYEITGYVVVLATLLLIKSRSLLPNFEITQEEKVTIEDLEDRLKLYKLYKDLSVDFARRYNKNTIYLKQPKKRDVVFIPDYRITLENMKSIIEEVLTHAPSVEKVEKHKDVVIKTTISLEEVMKRIEREVQALSSFRFSQFTGERKTFTKEEKIFTVISFLAILELIRTGVLTADQDETFGDMNITRNNTQELHYGE